MKGKESSKNNGTKKKGLTVVDMTKVALMAALFCVLAPHTINLPISPVGITLGSFLVYLAGALLGPYLGSLSILLYLIIGFAGLPVFSGYTSGAAKIVGPTGGYLIGYIPCAFIIGLFMKKYKKGIQGILVILIGAVVGTAVLYTFGTIWFLIVYTKGITLKDALGKCVIPFLPLDTVKIIVSAILVPPVYAALKRLETEGK